MFTTYFGYWLAGTALLSAGMLASSLTSSTSVAFVLGSLFVCGMPVYLIDKLPFFNPRLVQTLSLGEQFRDFSLGMIPAGRPWCISSR